MRNDLDFEVTGVPTGKLFQAGKQRLQIREGLRAIAFLARGA
ncbi:MAG: hypothetical protein WDO18_04560 [Acidobacteriota bacterium]